MARRFIEQRGPRDSEWSWERIDDVGGRAGGKRVLWNAILGSAFIGGAVATAIGIVLLATNGSGDAAPPPVSLAPTPEATAIATPAPAATSAPTLEPTATPAPLPPPGQQFDAQLAAWSDITSEWTTMNLDQKTSGYRAGDFVPFLLRIDDAKPGTTYDLQLTYECSASGKPAIDFLSGVALDQTAPLLTSPGPGSVAPDSALGQLDDSSINFDTQQQAWFLAWGAGFSRAEGPSPQTECTGAKTISTSLVAQDETVILIWAGHLASAADWGQGSDAASATPFSITAEINGWSQQSLTMLPGAVAR